MTAAARTVVGFTPGGEFLIKIRGFNEATIEFGGSNFLDWAISGSIDRVTGDLEAPSMMWSKTGDVDYETSYSPKCRPTQRMF